MSELLMISVPSVTMTPTTVLTRVVLVPRLQGAGTTLSDYGLQDWPHTITGASFDVSLRTSAGTELPAVSVPVHTEARADVWNAFFGTITVTSAGAPPAYTAPVVTPSTRHADQVTGAYAATTRAVGDPTVVDTQLAGLSFQAPPPPPDADAPVPVTDPTDFHRAVAMLREHPAVLRALGLIVDLQLDRAAVDRCGGSGAVRVGWSSGPSTFTTITSPWTLFTVVDGRFLAAASGPVTAGQVDLTTATGGEPDWTVQTVDVDGAVARLSGAKTAVAQRTARGAAAVAAGPADGVAMPALRSMGMQLTHRRREATFARRLTRAATQAARAASDPMTDLTAEDLVLGYRLDVREGNGGWYSMMRRQATYVVGGVTIAGPVSEEGHVKAAAAVQGTDGTLYADEVVVRWDGSRLAVPMPDPSGTPSAATVMQPAAGAAPYDFSWTFAADPGEPAGAPELRFSHSYQLRLRVADLAGGGLTTGDLAGEALAAPLQTYARHEPVLPPEMPPPDGLLVRLSDTGVEVHEEVLGPGGTLERLVVRSDPAGASPLPVYPANADRTFLPPVATFTLAEWEDKLSGADLETWRLARRALMAPRATAAPRDGRQYTWLPDPAAAGTSVTVIPASARTATAGPRVQGWDPTSWPDHTGKTVLVQPGAPGSSLTADWVSPTELHVSLPPAVRANLEAASTVDSVYFGRFAASQWAPVGSTAQQAVITGRHPMITPARRLEIVHAVRRPLSAPSGTLIATRGAGDTTVQVADPADPLIGVDRDSTLQVDVAATWQEWQDAPAPGDDAPGNGFVSPQTITRALGSLPVDLDAPALPPIHQDFGDTRHRTVTYRLAARSRFRAFFDPADPEGAFTNEATLAAIDVPNTVRPAPLTVIGAVPAFVTDRSTPGTVRRSGGTLRIELAGPWFTTGEGEQLGVVVAPAQGLPPSAWESGVTGPPADASGALAHLVTTAYRDPIEATAGPQQPTSATLAGAAGDPLVVRDLESGSPVCVVPFDVFRRGDRLFADVGFGNLTEYRSYSPMVRLSLVRFQRHSLVGLTSSAIVRTDLLNVLPARTLAVQQAGGTVTVTLTGHGPANLLDLRLESSSAPATSDLTSLDDIEPGWTLDGRFTGRLNNPSPAIPVAQDGRSHRLVVRELASVPGSRDASSTDPLVAELSDRVIFAGVVPL